MFFCPHRVLWILKSFAFSLDSDDVSYGCGDGRPARLDAWDCLFFFMKNKKNGKGEVDKKFWMPAEKEVVEEEAVLMSTSFENLYHPDKPLEQQGTVSEYPAFIRGQRIKAVALHNLVGIKGMSGECIYTQDKKCLLVFRGYYGDDVSSYLGVPLGPFKERLREKHGDSLKNFCIDSVPEDWQVEGYVESYILLVSTKTLEKEDEKS